MPSHKILNIARPDTSQQQALSKALGIPKILSSVLINRGLKSASEAEKFLNTKTEHLLDPYSFSDMPKAVNIIKNAVAHKEGVMIFGDYDVDGVTAVCLLKCALRKMGIEPLHYLPHRIKEGYGLNKDIVNIAKEKKIKLLITVDCSISSYAEVKALRGEGIEVIVTDHHEPQEQHLSSASATINPKLKGSNYKYRDLAGVGVAYKFTQALSKEMLLEDLDLVSLGTIADVVPLTGENRVMVKEGLSRLSQTRRPGLKALIENAGIKNKKFSTTSVSFMLGPRINASGRMDSAQTALNLMLSDTKEEAKRLADILEALNRQRQKVEGKILEEAQDLIGREVNFKEHKVIVLAKEDWHQGVLGVVASKLADRFYRPTIIISLGEGLCRGSGRSIKDFHLFHALSECKEFLHAFGGHSHAVGMVIDKNNIEDFKQQINQIAREKLSLNQMLPSLDIDLEINLSDLDSDAAYSLERLEPFGAGNPEPLFFTRNLKLKSQPQSLSRDTLKFWVTDGSATFEAIGFGMGSFREDLLNASSFDLVYTLKIDNWQDSESVILEAKDIFFR